MWEGLRALKSAIHGLPVKSGKFDWLRIRNEYSAHTQKIGSSQSSWSLSEARRIAGSGDENGFRHVEVLYIEVLFYTNFGQAKECRRYINIVNEVSFWRYLRPFGFLLQRMKQTGNSSLLKVADICFFHFLLPASMHRVHIDKDVWSKINKAFSLWRRRFVCRSHFLPIIWEKCKTFVLFHATLRPSRLAFLIIYCM